MDLGLKNKGVLVTAASRGLGRASALALGAEGARVALAARSVDTLHDLAEEINAGPGEAIVLPFDLSAPDSSERLVDDVTAAWGRLDAVVVNAPGPRSGPAHTLSDADWSSAIDLVLMSAVRLSRAAARVMIPQGEGRITYISTIGVRTVQPEMVLSNATRLAIMGLAKTMSLELAEHGIIVNQVAPGPIETDRMDELFAQTAERAGIDLEAARKLWTDEVPLRRMGRAEDVAAFVAYLSSPVCGFTTGAVIPVDGGKSRAY
ncbi:SDR family oxidoreductase [Pseudactinotalea sp. HY158]|uniref:SDR family oxidoreductase n=1 Tax=Pseudactinotalea sp. HY158 TaxID=2654547 RepID=UPI00129D1FDA|nr:SDR family oxidoreductase [Pseudactinotalea sp. HY158]QGH70708.1 SDR family oxidoreductase [Pseudactinotalea sp. HY158]